MWAPLTAKCLASADWEIGPVSSRATRMPKCGGSIPIGARATWKSRCIRSCSRVTRNAMLSRSGSGVSAARSGSTTRSSRDAQVLTLTDGEPRRDRVLDVLGVATPRTGGGGTLGRAGQGVGTPVVGVAHPLDEALVGEVGGDAHHGGAAHRRPCRPGRAATWTHRRRAPGGRRTRGCPPPRGAPPRGRPPPVALARQTRWPGRSERAGSRVRALRERRRCFITCSIVKALTIPRAGVSYRR